MTEDFRERLYIKLRYLNRPDCECVSDLMEFYLFQSVPFQETGEELPIAEYLCYRKGFTFATSLYLIAEIALK